jgi:hypothetical protein
MPSRTDWLTDRPLQSDSDCCLARRMVLTRDFSAFIRPQSFKFYMSRECLLCVYKGKKEEMYLYTHTHRRYLPSFEFCSQEGQKFVSSPPRPERLCDPPNSFHGEKRPESKDEYSFRSFVVCIA